ncbi:MAG: alpha-(1-_3)-arabinofuranosyltransferase family protein [Patescibacteria group bacterium]|nr:alpha-(1->3)-arabinofuranosyltransferase family protein [Patescibacteria group bacterium]
MLSSFFRFVSRKKFLLLSVLLCAVPLFWFHPWNTLITGSDFWLPLDPFNYLKNISSAWIENASGGQINNVPFHIIPWVGFWALFKLVSFSLSDIEKLWFVSLFLTGSISMYFLTKEIFRNKKEGWHNFLPSALYLFNLYIMITGVVTTTLLAYMFLPLIFWIYLRGLRSKDTFCYAFCFALVTVFMSSAAGNPPIYAIPFMAIFFFFVYALVFLRRERFFWKFNFLAAIFYLLFNAWWLYPFVRGLNSQIGIVESVTSAAVVGASSSFTDLIRLLGSWAFFAGNRGTPYFPFAASYLNPVLSGITFTVPVLVMFGIIFAYRSGKKTVSFFAVLAVIGILLAHGRANDIFGFVNSLFYRFVPFFWIYREPFAKFAALIAFSYSILLGALFAFLEDSFSSRWTVNLLGLSVTAVILTIAWPLVTGAHYPDARGVMPALRTQIPKYWFEVSAWFERQKPEGRVLILPDNPDYLRSGIPYIWGYDSADVAPLLLGVPWVERNNGFYPMPTLMDDVSKLAYNRIQGFSKIPSSITGLMKIMDVDYLLQRNDINLLRIDSHPENYSPDNMRQVISRQRDFTPEKSFGPLDVYRINKEQTLGRIYIPNEVDCLSGDKSALNFPLEFTGSGISPLILSDSKAAPYKDSTQLLCTTSYIVPWKLTKTNRQFTFSSILGTSLSAVPDNLYNSLDANEKVNRGEYAKTYYFVNDNPGQYDLYAAGLGQEQKYVRTTSLNLYNLNNSNSLVSGSSRGLPGFNGNFSYLKTLDLGGGSYELTIKFDGVESLIDKVSKGEWKSSLYRKAIPLSSDSYFSGGSLDLGPGSTDAYLAAPVSLSKNETYVFSFFYKVVSDYPPVLVIWENNCDVDEPIWVAAGSSSHNSTCSSNFIVQPSLGNYPDWSEYSIDYSPNPSSKRFGFVFAFLGGNGNIYENGGQTLLNGFSLRPKLESGFVLKRDNGQPLIQLPKVVTTASSATRYTAHISGAEKPFFLVLSETYSKDWKLSYMDNSSGVSSVSDARHFLVNGYANAWLLDKKGNYDVVINYEPERWFLFFVFVSFASLVLTTAYLVARKLFGSGLERSGFNWRRPK